MRLFPGSIYYVMFIYYVWFYREFTETLSIFHKIKAFHMIVYGLLF